jgi:hypothetical protein
MRAVNSSQSLHAEVPMARMVLTFAFLAVSVLTYSSAALAADQATLYLVLLGPNGPVTLPPTVVGTFKSFDDCQKAAKQGVEASGLKDLNSVSQAALICVINGK